MSTNMTSCGSGLRCGHFIGQFLYDLWHGLCFKYKFRRLFLNLTRNNKPDSTDATAIYLEIDVAGLDPIGRGIPFRILIALLLVDHP
jgi:hypothetical protein